MPDCPPKGTRRGRDDGSTSRLCRLRYASDGFGSIAQIYWCNDPRTHKPIGQAGGRRSQPLARHVEDRIGVFGVLLQYLDGFDRGKNQQFDVATLRDVLYFFHHRQSSVCTGADHESVAFPRYVLLDRKRRVSEVGAEFFTWLFLAFADLPMIDHDIVFVGAAVDL